MSKPDIEIAQPAPEPYPGIFIDDLTQTRTIIPNYTNKPLPSKPRSFPQSSNTCPFCLLSSQIPSPTLTDEYATRDLLAYNKSAFLIPNLWGPLLNSNGTNLLLIPRNHYLSFEDLPPAELYDFLTLIEESYSTALPDNSKFIFFNIGIPAGSSIAHLHAQLISFPHQPTFIHSNLTKLESVYLDYLRSFSADLVINPISTNPLTLEQLSTNPQAYIPLVASRSLEVRFIGGSSYDRALLIQKIISLFASDYNYNLTLFPTSTFAQLLPALDYGIIYPRFLDLTIQLQPSQTFANTLANLYKNSFIDPNQP